MLKHTQTACGSGSYSVTPSLSGAVSGAVAGARIGSLVPGIGTTISHLFDCFNFELFGIAVVAHKHLF